MIFDRPVVRLGLQQLFKAAHVDCLDKGTLGPGEALVDHVRTLAKSCNANTRREILDQLQSLCHSIESPDDTVQRISFLNLQLAGLRIGADLKLFNILSESSSPLTIDQISKNTKADPVLLGLSRILEHS